MIPAQDRATPGGAGQDRADGDRAGQGGAALVVEWRSGRPVDLRAVLGPLRRGGYDPAVRFGRDGSVWRAVRTPDGPATQRLAVERPAAADGPSPGGPGGHGCAPAAPGPGRVPAQGGAPGAPVPQGVPGAAGTRAAAVVRAEHWGPGAAWCAGRVADLLGGADDDSGFDCSGVPVLHEARRRHPGWRVPRTGTLLDALVAAVLEQKVALSSARSAWCWLLRRYGDPAPGPAPDGMRVVPSADRIARVPSWEWHRAGVQPAQSRTVVRAMPYLAALGRGGDLPGEEARARLTVLPGIGPWTAAEVAHRTWGDADAFSFGDLHVPGDVVYALTGRTDGDDAACAELLRPFAGHRYRVQRLVELAGVSRPRRGPRLAVVDHRGR